MVLVNITFNNILWCINEYNKKYYTDIIACSHIIIYTDLLVHICIYTYIILYNDKVIYIKCKMIYDTVVYNINRRPSWPAFAYKIVYDTAVYNINRRPAFAYKMIYDTVV